jgi:hypothetical protein
MKEGGPKGLHADTGSLKKVQNYRRRLLIGCRDIWAN